MKSQRYLLMTILVLMFAVLLSACFAAAEPSLSGTHWLLTELNGQPAVPDRQPTLNFEEKQVSGNGSCNGFGGDYTVSGDQLTFGPIMSTMMACVENGIMDQESAYFDALGKVARYNIENETLILLSADGTVLARFTPAP